MNCTCGEENIHRYFKYHSKGIERYICYKWGKCYEVCNGQVTVLTTPNIDIGALERLRREIGL